MLASLLLSPKKYRYIGRWPTCKLEESFWLFWSATDAVRNAGIKKVGFEEVVIHQRYYLQRERAYDEITNRVRSYLCKKNSDALLASLIRVARSIDRRGIEITTTYGAQTTNRQAMLQVFCLYRDAVFPWMACFAVSDAIDAIFSRDKQCAEIGVENIMQLFPVPRTLSMRDTIELYRWKNILTRAGFQKRAVFTTIQRTSPVIAKRLLTYQRKTAFLGTHAFQGKPRSMKALLGAIATSAKSVDTPFARKQTMHLSDTVRRTAKTASLFTYIRLQMAERLAQVTYCVRPAMERFALQNGLRYEELLRFTYQEIFDALDSGKILKKQLASLRSGETSSTVFSSRGRVEVITGKRHRMLKKRFLSYFEESTDDFDGTIKGNIGCRGKVRGKVIVLLSAHGNLEKVRKGMILVCIETTPDFLPVMKKAAAFVTDQGGITSHAAIVARELKKPCIIGTKIATKVLKDGDLVEVDAEKGVVRKVIEKHA